MAFLRKVASDCEIPVRSHAAFHLAMPLLHARPEYMSQRVQSWAGHLVALSQCLCGEGPVAPDRRDSPAGLLTLAQSLRGHSAPAQLLGEAFPWVQYSTAWTRGPTARRTVASFYRLLAQPPGVQ